MLTDGGGIIKNQWQLYLKQEDQLPPRPSRSPIIPTKTQNADPNPTQQTPDLAPPNPTNNHILTAISTEKLSSQEQSPASRSGSGLTNNSVFSSKEDVVSKPSEISTSNHLNVNGFK
jgi:hypothetical protein